MTIVLYIQGVSIKPFLGCKNAAGKLRKKKQATAGTKFTKPGDGLIEIPCASTIMTKPGFLTFFPPLLDKGRRKRLHNERA